MTSSTRASYSINKWTLHSPSLNFILCLSSLLITAPISCVSASNENSIRNKLPRIGVFGGTFIQGERNGGKKRPSAAPTSSGQDLKRYYYNQTLDHFNYRPESYATFKQRYYVNSKHWGGAEANAPFLVYFGAEVPLDLDTRGVGFLDYSAPQLKALTLYIEHRFYGNSIPFGLTMEQVMKNASVRGYFSSEQAIADYAEVILRLKEQLDAHYSPVIVIGGSYGGMLASWFRLKYPHIALGALASSAPILYFDNITSQDAYTDVVTKDFKDESKSCYNTIRKSWAEMDRVAAQPYGLSNLSKKFKTCSELTDVEDLKNYFWGVYTVAAQYNYRPPINRVTRLCNGIDGSNETDIIDRIYSGLVAEKGKQNCYNLTAVISPTDQTSVGYGWQRCSEMVSPFGVTNDNSMFPLSPFNLSDYINDCIRRFNVPPRPHWVTTFYGGHDIKLVLQRLGGNIIFSNGLKDPYSSVGILKNISTSIVALSTEEGSHCVDLLAKQASDPDWLVNQRKIEVQIIQQWIQNYYHDLEKYHGNL